MRCNIFYVDQITGAKSLNNVRSLDEIAEDNGMSDDEADAMESAIKSEGVFMIGGGAAPLFEIRKA